MNYKYGCYSLPFLDRFAKLRKRLLASFCLSVHLFVRAKQLGSHWTYFHEIYFSRIFRKTVKIKVSLISDKNDVTLREDQWTFLMIYIQFFVTGILGSNPDTDRRFRFKP